VGFFERGFQPFEVADRILEGRHGQFAAEVAEFFASLHTDRGDAGRSWAWAGVAARVRQRERQRIGTG
jgi:hypothetical protein